MFFLKFSVGIISHIPCSFSYLPPLSLPPLSIVIIWIRVTLGSFSVLVACNFLVLLSSGYAYIINRHHPIPF